MRLAPSMTNLVLFWFNVCFALAGASLVSETSSITLVDPAGEVDSLSAEGNATTAIGIGSDRLEPTFGLFTRVTEADLPYFVSFLRHYISIGVNTFYLMNQNFKDGHKELMTYVEGVEMPPTSKIEWLSIANIIHDDPVRTPGLVSAMTDDYVINVDADEYWVLPDGIKDLGTLVKEHPAELFYMRWVMIVSDAIKTRWRWPYQGNLGFPGKWMAKRTLLPSPRVPYRLFGHHVVPLKRGLDPEALGDYQYGMNWSVGDSMFGRSFPLFGKPIKMKENFDPGYIAHFWCRSFYDVVLKTQRFNKGEPCIPLSEYVETMKETPERLRTLAFLSLNTKEPRTLDVGKELLAIDTDLEKKLALQAACEGNVEKNEKSIQEFRFAYEKYKDHLSSLMAAGAYPSHWPETSLSMKTDTGLTVTDWLYSLPE